MEEDVLFLLLWAEAIWECVNLELGWKGWVHPGHPWESVPSFSCSWKALMSRLVLGVVQMTSASSGKQSLNQSFIGYLPLWVLPV